MNIVFTMPDGTMLIVYDVEFGGTQTPIPEGAVSVSVFLKTIIEVIDDLDNL